MGIQLSKIKEKIFYNCKGNKVQKLVLTALYKRLSEKKLPDGFEFMLQSGYNLREWEEKAVKLNSLSAMKAVIEVYELNNSDDPRPFIYCQVL